MINELVLYSLFSLEPGINYFLETAVRAGKMIKKPKFTLLPINTELLYILVLSITIFLSQIGSEKVRAHFKW